MFRHLIPGLGILNLAIFIAQILLGDPGIGIEGWLGGFSSLEPAQTTARTAAIAFRLSTLGSSHRPNFREAQRRRKSLTKRRRTGYELYRFNGHAGLVHLKQDKTNSFMLRRTWIGSHECEHPVGVVRARRPNLLPIDDKVITLQYCSRLQTGEIRA